LAAGGFCRLRGKQLIILDERFSTEKKVHMLVKSLQRFDLRDVYVKPAVRDLLENQSREEATKG
jgi:hypothetical protein